LIPAVLAGIWFHVYNIVWWLQFRWSQTWWNQADFNYKVGWPRLSPL